MGLFEFAVYATRDEAMTALRRRADANGLIITTCGWCDKYIGEQDGRGVTGLSTGICEACKPALAVGEEAAKSVGHPGLG